MCGWGFETYKNNIYFYRLLVWVSILSQYKVDFGTCVLIECSNEMKWNIDLWLDRNMTWQNIMALFDSCRWPHVVG